VRRKLIAHPQRIPQHFPALDFLDTHALAVTQIVQYRIFSGEIAQALHQRQSNLPDLRSLARHRGQIEEPRPEAIELGRGILLDQPPRYHHLQEPTHRARGKSQAATDLKQRLLRTVGFERIEQVDGFF
jgi:hypothetical protein